MWARTHAHTHTHTRIRAAMVPVCPKALVLAHTASSGKSDQQMAPAQAVLQKLGSSKICFLPSRSARDIQTGQSREVSSSSQFLRKPDGLSPGLPQSKFQLLCGPTRGGPTSLRSLFRFCVPWSHPTWEGRAAWKFLHSISLQGA